jgi:hypothetical protein
MQNSGSTDGLLLGVSTARGIVPPALSPERSRRRNVVRDHSSPEGIVMAEPSRSPFPRAVEGAAQSTDTVTDAVRDVGGNFDEKVDDLGRKGREALQDAKDAWDALGDALERSIQTRPYTMLAVAGFIGFLYGATRRH